MQQHPNNHSNLELWIYSVRGPSGVEIGIGNIIKRYNIFTTFSIPDICLKGLTLNIWSRCTHLGD